MTNFNSKEYWNRKRIDYQYAKGNRCFIVDESNAENCKGCRWYERAKAKLEVKESEEDGD